MSYKNSSQHRIIQKKYTVKNYTNILLFKEQHYVIYKGKIDIKDLEKFVNHPESIKGGLNIPIPLTFFDKTMWFIGKVISGYFKIMDKMGLSFLSDSMKIVVIIGFITIPIILIIVCMCKLKSKLMPYYEDEDNETEDSKTDKTKKD